METLLPGSTNSQSLKTVLKTYQLSAVKSLQGPSSALLDCKDLLQDQPSPFHLTLNRTSNVIVEAEKKENHIPVSVISHLNLHEDSDDDVIPSKEKRDPEFQIPILTAPDQSCSERCETFLENERISCFVVGGERRLCLPQILNTVLQDFSLQQINQVCDELQIYCSRCTHDQLEELKHSGILPRNAPSCGLITQTDAERLVSALLLRTELAVEAVNVDSVKGVKIDDSLKKEMVGDEVVRFKVYHECFGKCKGIFDADLFDSEDSPCIECLECGCQFSPQRFVRHAHRPLENRTCHWGFDSNNWRSYLLLSRDQNHYNKVATLFRNLKERYPMPNFKRKLPELKHETEKVLKRAKKEITRDECTNVYSNTNGLGMYPVSGAGGEADPYFMQWAVLELAARGASAFRPWNASTKHRDSSPLVPAYLSCGPPVLQHPERVVPLSECERFEPHFQPNVALAPIPATSITQIPPPSVPSHRRSYHEKRRLNNHSNSESKIEPVIVKIEKPPTPAPECLESCEEEESSAAVTSSTITADPLPPPSTSNTVNKSASSISSSSSSSSSSSDSEPDGSTGSAPTIETIAGELEERLKILDVPKDVLDLARKLASEIKYLKLRNHSNDIEIAKLKIELEKRDKNDYHKTVITSDNGDKKTFGVSNSSAADSTEGNDTDKVMLSNHSPIEPEIVYTTSDITDKKD